MKTIYNSYNSIAAGENSFSSGLLDAVMNKEKTLFCYADSVDKYESISILIDYDEGEKVVIKENSNNLLPNSFNEFIKGGKYICPLFVMERVND